jgi:hypothetical protein
MNTVIYHSADYDGIFCREIAKKFLPDAELIGWNFGDPRIPLPTGNGHQTYILDLSPDCVNFSTKEPYSQLNDIIWIDHHKTSIEKWPDTINGYRIDGVAACRLAWQWFSQIGPDNPQSDPVLPRKLDFIDRKVFEPLAVRLAGEYDIWDKRDERSETFQYGLRAKENLIWEAMLVTGKPHPNIGYPVVDGYTLGVVADGLIAQRYAKDVDTSICKHRTWLMKWEGLNFLCVNSARFNSLFFASKDTPETGHDALLGFCFDGKCWTVSLYHAKYRTDLDLSEIAKKHGGGGHRGACGFTSKTLPFDLTT